MSKVEAVKEDVFVHLNIEFYKGLGLEESVIEKIEAIWDVISFKEYEKEWNASKKASSNNEEESFKSELFYRVEGLMLVGAKGERAFVKREASDVKKGMHNYRIKIEFPLNLTLKEEQRPFLSLASKFFREKICSKFEDVKEGEDFKTITKGKFREFGYEQVFDDNKIVAGTIRKKLYSNDKVEYGLHTNKEERFQRRKKLIRKKYKDYRNDQKNQNEAIDLIKDDLSKVYKNTKDPIYLIETDSIKQIINSKK